MNLRTLRSRRRPLMLWLVRRRLAFAVSPLTARIWSEALYRTAHPGADADGLLLPPEVSDPQEYRRAFYAGEVGGFTRVWWDGDKLRTEAVDPYATPR